MDEKETISQIETLLDELESYAEKSPWYMPGKIVIPDEDFFRIAQQVRETLPGELSEARKLFEKRDLILKNAQEEHKRIIDSAERRLEDMTSEERIVQEAKMRAAEIVAHARAEAESIKRDALSYTGDLLEDMEQQFGNTIETIRKGREFIASEINEDMEDNMAAAGKSAEEAVTDEESGE